MSKLLLRSMTELSSRKWISKLTGAFSKSAASRLFIARFAKMYNIKIEEAEKPIDQYRTLNAFFSRRLKPGARSIDPAPDSCVSPVDALITGIGSIEDGLMLSVKGQNYSVSELLNSSEDARLYHNGFYFVLYLSPTDYHRIHSPVDGLIERRKHLAGKVYPVNDFGLTHMKRVLSRNERLITYMKHDTGEIAVVKVGAMNVSSIQYALPLSDQAQKGSELAYFEFGSTVVLLLENNTFEPRADLSLGSKVKMGERLGTFVAPK
ncbi:MULTISPECIES: archaetidylserine decarboxylase [unclassified Paenibacillus]|uniref:archaetidylserine decarboxylase n=1 Tax=unclassified Paenibacillus TaxID=185978 RepID=UPI002F3EF8F0